ncbi:MAG: DUF397 domain-containing protein [Streptosporangiaceae bacterium]
MRRPFWNAAKSGRYYRQHGILPSDITQAGWLKSSYCGYNNSCFEIARLGENRIGVRDTKDRGVGPVLVFTQAEWTAFLAGAKGGEFDPL